MNKRNQIPCCSLQAYWHFKQFKLLISSTSSFGTQLGSVIDHIFISFFFTLNKEQIHFWLSCDALWFPSLWVEKIVREKTDSFFVVFNLIKKTDVFNLSPLVIIISYRKNGWGSNENVFILFVDEWKVNDKLRNPQVWFSRSPQIECSHSQQPICSLIHYLLQITT